MVNVDSIAAHLVQEIVPLVVEDVIQHAQLIALLLAQQPVRDAPAHAVEGVLDVDHVAHPVVLIVVPHVVTLVRQHVLD